MRDPQSARRALHGPLHQLWDHLLQKAETDADALERFFPIQFAESLWEAASIHSPTPDEDADALAGLLREWLTPDPALYRQWNADRALDFADQVLPHYKQAFADDLADSDGLLFQVFTVKATRQILAEVREIMDLIQPRPVIDPAPAPERPTDRNSLPPITFLRGQHRMPFRSLGDQFVGRVDALWTAFDQLSQGKTSIVQGVGVVYGTGGLGKTQLAVEYVHRFNPYYPGGVFWIEADQGLSRLITVLASGAGVEIDGRLPESDQFAAPGPRSPDDRPRSSCSTTSPKPARSVRGCPPPATSTSW